MICAQLDSQLQKLAAEHRCTYTRYADDITFSTSVRTFPAALASVNELNQTVPGNELARVIQGNGFTINQSKVKLRCQDRRQEVTGLTVNNFPNVTRKYLNQIRAMLHDWQKNGYDAAQAKFDAQFNKKHRPPWKGSTPFRLVVKGKIEYLGMVRGKGSPIYLKFIEKLRALDPTLAPAVDEPRNQLLTRYDAMAASDDPHGRGFLLQDLLRDTFRFFGIRVLKSFTRNSGGEQIDGAFEHNGMYCIVECRWRAQLADIRQVDGLMGQVRRSGFQTIGLYFSINGWSVNVVPLLKQNPEKRILLMNGDDFRRVLTGEIADFGAFLKAKFSHLSFHAEPYYSAADFLRDTPN